MADLSTIASEGAATHEEGCRFTAEEIERLSDKIEGLASRDGTCIYRTRNHHDFPREILTEREEIGPNDNMPFIWRTFVPSGWLPRPGTTPAMLRVPRTRTTAAVAEEGSNAGKDAEARGFPSPLSPTIAAGGCT